MRRRLGRRRLSVSEAIVLGNSELLRRWWLARRWVPRVCPACRAEWSVRDDVADLACTCGRCGREGVLTMNAYRSAKIIFCVGTAACGGGQFVTGTADSGDVDVGQIDVVAGESSVQSDGSLDGASVALPDADAGPLQAVEGGAGDAGDGDRELADAPLEGGGGPLEGGAGDAGPHDAGNAGDAGHVLCCRGACGTGQMPMCSGTNPLIAVVCYSDGGCTVPCSIGTPMPGSVVACN